MGDQVIEEVTVISTTTTTIVADEPMEDVVAAAMDGVVKKPLAVAEAEVQSDGEANGNADVVAADAPLEQRQDSSPVEDVPAPSTEEDKLWTVVKTNSGDFNAWTQLIQETEKLDVVPKIRKVYDAFLGEFPLCYGYWKKYADHEARLGAPEKIIEVYERAVKAVTYSVDIWMHYASYAMEKFEDPDDVRRLFERGITFVGTDYLSHLLWDKYIDFEYSQQEWSKLARIYTLILQIPLHQLDRYYERFKLLATSRPLAELRSPEENAEAATSATSSAALDAPLADGGPEAPPGDMEIPKVEKSSEAEDVDRFIGVRDTLYKKAKEWDAKIRDFETAIRRPYFHVKPLDDMQLGNWHRYLDFIEKEGDTDKVVKLYERCLIACANYPEYWIRYVQRLEETTGANEALSRATDIFVKRRPEIHLFAARYRENQGDIKGARSEYELLDAELAPGLLEAVIKHANFEHRQGNEEAAIRLFMTAIETETTKEESRSLPLLYIQYARFLDQVAGRTDQAREVYVAALEHLPRSKVLWEAVIHFESIHNGEKQLLRLDALVDQATASLRPDGSQGLNATEREEISSIYLEVVDLFGDVQTIKKAEHRHRTLFPLRKASSESKKRPSPESNISERAKVHKPYSGHTVASPAPAPMTYANGQSQWGGGYGPQGYAQQPQGWQQPPPQQAPPVQPQQWNPAYGGQQDMHGGYGGYGGYAGYGPPQQPQAPQQQAGYAGYGQQYPPQDFSQQQSYTQGVPTYRAPPPPAPPQSQQQAYYAGYY